MPKKRISRNKQNKKVKRSKLVSAKRTRIKKQKPSFLKRMISFVFLSFIISVSLAILIFYFVLPLVFSNTKIIKNTLIISSDLGEQSSDMLLTHFSTNKDENFIATINGDEIIELEDGYGKYNLGSIYQLLKIDHKSDQEIKSVFSNLLKISIDDIVIANKINANLVDNNLKGIFLDSFISKKDNSIDNRLKLATLYFLSDSISVSNLDDIADIETIFYKLSTLEEESYQNCSVSVLNTTSETGLAKRVSEIIENTGAQVMQVDGTSKTIQETTVYYPTEKIECQYLIDRISGIFPSEVLVKDSKELTSTQQFRSSVVIMLGENF